METDPVTPLNSTPEASNDLARDPRAGSIPETTQAASSSVHNPTHNSAESLSTQIHRESAIAPFAEIFIGRAKLYPGARWLIYLALAYLTFGVLSFLISGLRPEPIPAWWTMVGETRMMLAVILPAFVMARIEGCPFGDFGLPAQRAFGRDFWAGTLWGIGSLSVLIFALAAARAYSFGPLNLHGVRTFKFASYYAIFFLIVAFFEDFFMRGYSQWVLARGMHFWPAAALLSIVFGIMHLMNPGEARIGIAAVVAIGFFFCLTLRRTGTLWWAVGFHMAWDWGESYLYSVPDSGTVAHGHLLNSTLRGPDWLTGGSVGPEGSYLLFVLIAGLWLSFSWAYPEVKYRVGKGISEVPPSPPGLLES